MSSLPQFSADQCKVCGAPLSSAAKGGNCVKCALGEALEGTRAETLGASVQSSGISMQLDQVGGPAQRFGDYELLEEIARGGMGVVYKARQVSLDRFVAVKMLLFGSLASKDFVQRFRVEASAAASLRHPNIVTVHEVGVHEGQHYLVMDYIAGQTLSKLSGGQPLASRRAAAYIKTIAEAIHFAHEHGVLHRDLKPANVLIDQNDRPHVTDFGLAKRLDADSDLTLSGQVLGSPGYMSPEQASGKRGQVGKYSDVYSLGAILFHLLTGRPPFVAENVNDTIQLVLEREPITPRVLVMGIPRDLETICLKCLQKEPSKRYRTAEELAEELGRFLRNEPIRARRVSKPEQLWRWCRRNPAVAGLLMALSLVFLLGSAGMAWLFVGKQKSLVEMRRLLYAEEMSRAQQAWNGGNIEGTRDLLKNQVPRHGEEDLRGFEWRYFHRLARGQELETLPLLTNEVLDLSISGDGRLLAAATRSNTIEIFDLATRQIVKTLSGHTGAVTSAAFATNSTLLATGSADRTVKLWDTKSWQEVRTLPGHQGSVSCVAFAPDGRKLVSGSADRSVKLWDVLAQRELRTLANLNAAVLSVAFSPDGSQLAVSGENGLFRLEDVASGAKVAIAPFYSLFWIRGLCFSPDGQRIAVPHDHTITVLDIAHGQVKSTPYAPAPYWALALSPDGKTLAAGSFYGVIELWDLDTLQKITMLRGQPEVINSIAFSPDGKYLFSSSADRTVKMWSTTPAQDHAILRGHTYIPYAVAISPDSKTLVSADWMNFANEAILRDHTNLANAVAVTLDSKIAGSPNWETSVKQWDLTKDLAGRQEPIQLKGLTQAIRDMAISPDGSFLATAGGDEVRTERPAEIKLWEMRTQREVTNFVGQTGSIRSVWFSPDGQTLVTAAWDHQLNSLYFWDIPTGRVHDHCDWQTQSVLAVKFAGKRTILATAEDDRTLKENAVKDPTVRLWDWPAKKPIAVLRGHRNSLRSAAFSADGNLLATGGLDMTVKLWDVTNGKEICTFAGHQDRVMSLAFSPDNKTLASASCDNTVKLWSLSARREVASLDAKAEGVMKVAFSTDGTSLVAGCLDHTVRVWRALSLAEMQAVK